MKVRILGTGGFDNEGLPFNAYMLDDRILAETPPDILQSLRRESIPLASIETVILSHYHGDHCFGLPFFVFNAAKAHGGRPPRPLVLAGPPGLRAKAEQLLSMAISADSPYLSWFRDNVRLEEIGPGSGLDLGRGLWARFLPTEHPVPTFAMLAGSGSPDGVPLFASTSDTAWGPKAAAIYGCGAKLMLCDANGGPGSKVHMSPMEVAEKGMPLLGPGTMVLGTHLSVEFPEECPGLRFARPGDVFEVD